MEQKQNTISTPGLTPGQSTWSGKERRAFLRLKLAPPVNPKNKTKVMAENIWTCITADILDISKGGVKVCFPITEYHERMRFTSLSVEIRGSSVDGRIIWTKADSPRITVGIAFRNLGLWKKIKVDKAIKEFKI